MGELAISRAIGNAEFKDENLKLVIADPEIQSDLLRDEDEFAVIACDGVFDVLSSDECVQFVRQHLKQHGDPRKAAEALVRHAIDDLRSRDNVTALIITFH